MKIILYITIFTFISISCGRYYIYNTKQLVIKNIMIYFYDVWNSKAEKTKPCSAIIIGLPDNPYEQKQNIKLKLNDDRIINLSSKTIINDLFKLFPRYSKHDESGHTVMFRNPKEHIYYWKDQTTSYYKSDFFIFFTRKGKFISINLRLHANSFKSIEVNGNKKMFPLFEKDVIDLFGKPDKEARFLTQ